MSASKSTISAWGRHGPSVRCTRSGRSASPPTGCSTTSPPPARMRTPSSLAGILVLLTMAMRRPRKRPPPLRRDIRHPFTPMTSYAVGSIGLPAELLSVIHSGLTSQSPFATAKRSLNVRLTGRSVLVTVTLKFGEIVAAVLRQATGIAEHTTAGMCLQPLRPQLVRHENRDAGRRGNTETACNRVTAQTRTHDVINNHPFPCVSLQLSKCVQLYVMFAPKDAKPILLRLHPSRHRPRARCCFAHGAGARGRRQIGGSE